MRNRILAIVFLVSLIAAVPLFAGGDQNQLCHHGELGQGSVVQNQVRVNVPDSVGTIIDAIVLSMIP